MRKVFSIFAFVQSEFDVISAFITIKWNWSGGRNRPGKPPHEVCWASPNSQRRYAVNLRCSFWNYLIRLQRLEIQINSRGVHYDRPYVPLRHIEATFRKDSSSLELRTAVKYNGKRLLPNKLQHRRANYVWLVCWPWTQRCSYTAKMKWRRLAGTTMKCCRETGEWVAPRSLWTRFVRKRAYLTFSVDQKSLAPLYNYEVLWKHLSQ